MMMTIKIILLDYYIESFYKYNLIMSKQIQVTCCDIVSGKPIGFKLYQDLCIKKAEKT